MLIEAVLEPARFETLQTYSPSIAALALIINSLPSCITGNNGRPSARDHVILAVVLEEHVIRVSVPAAKVVFFGELMDGNGNSI